MINNRNYKDRRSEAAKKASELMRHKEPGKSGRPRSFEHSLWATPGMPEKAEELNQNIVATHLQWSYDERHWKLKHWDEIKHLPVDQQPRHYLGPTCTKNGHRMPGHGDRAVRIAHKAHQCLHCTMGLPPMVNSFKPDEEV